MKYQAGTVLPYWVKTQLLRRKGLVSPSLYTPKGFGADDSDVDVGAPPVKGEA